MTLCLAFNHPDGNIYFACDDRIVGGNTIYQTTPDDKCLYSGYTFPSRKTIMFSGYDYVKNKIETLFWGDPDVSKLLKDANNKEGVINLCRFIKQSFTANDSYYLLIGSGDKLFHCIFDSKRNVVTVVESVKPIAIGSGSDAAVALTNLLLDAQEAPFSIIEKVFKYVAEVDVSVSSNHYIEVHAKE